MVENFIKAAPYNWPHDGSLSTQNTALIVIDMQNDFCSEQGYLAHLGYSVVPMRAVIPPIAQLLENFRKHGFPIFHTREGHRPDLSTLLPRERFRSRNHQASTHDATPLGIGDVGPLGRMLIRGEPGHDIIPELTPLTGEPIIDKPGKSAFAYTDLELLLRIRGIKNLVLCGVTMEVCVGTTMREGCDRGYDCLTVEDATGATSEDMRKAAVEMVGQEGGIFGAVARVQEVLEGLEGASQK